MKKMNLLSYLLLSSITMFTACTNVNEPEPEPTAALPFSETFATNLGNFTTQSVLGDQVWAYDTHGYVTISGYVNSVNNANEDWLISPEIDLTGVTAAKLTFDHVARYFADLKTQATVWVSENYVDGLPATATWTQLTTKAFVDPGSWPTELPSSGEISLTAYAGKKIKIAFKYLSTDTKAGTWELKNFLVEEGEAANTSIGGDTEANALSVADAIANQTGEVKWVKGYIVGCVKNGVTAFETSADALFDSFDSSTNVFIADNANETDYTKCLSIKLNDTNAPAEMRGAVNLLDHPENKGKELKVQGALKAMFTTLNGCREIVDWKLEGYVAPTGDFAVPEMSIADLRAEWTGAVKTLTDKKKIVGVVITDLVGGNNGSLKNLTIASTDNNAGIMIRFTANHSYNMGDKIEISLEGLELNQYGLAIQLNNVPLIKSQKIGTGTITPKVTTIANVNANYASFESTVVTVTGTVTSPNGMWGSSTANQNNTLTNGSDQITLYVTKYASFVATAIPVGEKSVTGIVGQYSTSTTATYQLIVRNLDDIK